MNLTKSTPIVVGLKMFKKKGFGSGWGSTTVFHLGSGLALRSGSYRFRDRFRSVRYRSPRSRESVSTDGRKQSGPVPVWFGTRPDRDGRSRGARGDRVPAPPRSAAARTRKRVSARFLLRIARGGRRSGRETPDWVAGREGKAARPVGRARWRHEERSDTPRNSVVVGLDERRRRRAEERGEEKKPIARLPGWLRAEKKIKNVLAKCTGRRT